MPDGTQIFGPNSKTFFGVTMESRFISELRWNSHQIRRWLWQRRMGVEPTRDRAERPPSRFEDGETHRGPYTSISAAVLCHLYYLYVKPAYAPAPHPPRSRTLPSTRPHVSQGDHDPPLPQYSAYRPRVQLVPQ